MNENRGIIWKWAVGLLALCNIALMLTIWLKPSRVQEPPHETPRDFLIRNVKFNEDQVARYDVLIAAHRRAMNNLRREAMQCRQQLFGNLKSEGGAKINADSLAAVIANTQKEIELVTYHHFEQVRTICTGEQIAAFDHIIGAVIRKMNGGMRGGPPPHDDPPPPRDGNHEGPPPTDHNDGPPQ